MFRINKEKCIKACSEEIFATEHAYNLVKNGVSFRDAYHQVSQNIGNLSKVDPLKNIQSKKYSGATGNLGLNKLKKQIKSMYAKVDFEINKFNSKMKVLLKLLI